MMMVEKPFPTHFSYYFQHFRIEEGYQELGNRRSLVSFYSVKGKKEFECILNCVLSYPVCCAACYAVCYVIVLYDVGCGVLRIENKGMKIEKRRERRKTLHLTSTRLHSIALKIT